MEVAEVAVEKDAVKDAVLVPGVAAKLSRC
eukprot:SAG31_NODE_331_length_17518_cov_32.495042_4_plen_30_part_00